MKNIINIVILTAIVLAILWGAIGALGKTVDGKSIMLCDSAKKSGNEEWLDRCDTYYKTNNPLDIR